MSVALRSARAGLHQVVGKTSGARRSSTAAEASLSIRKRDRPVAARPPRANNILGECQPRPAREVIMHLVMAVVWLAGAVGLFIYEYLKPEFQARIRGTNISIGWLLVLLGLYNLARWYSSRAYRREQE